MNDITIAEEKIRSYSEDELQDMLVKLFKEMHFKNVEKNCGTQEYGKDIFFTQIDQITQTNYACVIKAGDINQTISNKVIEQATNSFDIPANTKNGKLQIQKVIVITNGVFKQNAQSIISNSRYLKSKEGFILFWDINDLVQNSLKFIPTLIISDQNIQLTEYKEKILQKLTSFDSLKFLQTDFGYNIDRLEEFEIKCRTRYNSLKREKNQYLDEPHNERVYLSNLSDEEAIFRTDYNYLISGIPTSGKTSLLKRLGRQFIKNYPDNYLFYIDLNKSYEELIESGFDVFLTKAFTHYVSHDLDLKVIQDAKTLILFDGLDELPDDDSRTKVIQQIIDFKTQYPKTQHIVTSRNIEFILNNPIIDDNFEKYELLPLNIEEFVKIGEKFLGTGDLVGEYMVLVKKSELINAFPKTPLTSILLCILFKEKQINIHELPANITELYKKFLDLFLNKWDASKGLSQQFKFQQKEYILQSIAKFMHDNNLVYIDEESLLKLLQNLKNTRPIDDLKDPALFIKELAKNTNIIKKSVNNGNDEYSFFHLTIQEYLASQRIKTSDEDYLIENIYNDWWLNPLIFYTGKEPDNASLIKKIGELKNYPIEGPNKIKFIINSSLILTAAHLIPNKERKILLGSMIKIFDELLKLIISNITLSENNPFKQKTVLDLILDARNLFYSRFRINSFSDVLKELWGEIKSNRTVYSDITQYCITYTLSLKLQKEDYLLEFIDYPDLNVRWDKIVYVDIYINKLKHKGTNDKLLNKIKKKARDNAKYINEQFKQPIKKHTSSLLDLSK